MIGNRVWIASIVGSAIEWFDYFLYGTLASLVFNKLFFPAADPVVSLLLSYLSFSLTFFIRPLGAAFFSFIGDKAGRKKTLVLTLAMMGGATVLIGLLPTYGQIGLAAPCLLVLLRLVQGLGVGGEWGGALLLAVEYAPAEKKGLWGSLPQTGPSLGLLLSTICVSLTSLMPEPVFLSWGWRIPFILSAFLVLLGLWIRQGIRETPEFRALQAAHKTVANPLAKTVRLYWREILVAVAAKFVETAPFYIFTVLSVSYGTSVLHIARLDALNAVTVGAFVAILVIPLVGRLSDRIGHRRMFLLGCCLMAAFAFPYFMILSRGTAGAMLLATVVGMGLLYASVTAVLGTVLSEIFDTQVRYTGVSLGYQIGAALAGGTAPLVGTWLLSRPGGWHDLSLYIILTAAISAAAVLLASRISRRKMTTA